MSYQIEVLKRVGYAIEQSGSYATNLSGSTTYTDVRTISAEMGLNLEYLENQTMQQMLDATEAKIPSRRRSTFNMASYLVGSGTPVSGTTYVETTPHSDILSVIMGGSYISSGSTVTAGSTTTYVTQSATANDKYAGSAVGFFNSGSNRLEAVRVRDYNTTSRAMLFEHALPFQPATGDIVYGSQTIFLAGDPNRSLQFYVRGKNTSDTWVLQGLQGGFGLTFANGELLQINYELEGATWSTGSVETLQEATYNDSNPLPIVDARVYFYAYSSGSVSTATCLPVQSWELTPNLTYVDITTPCTTTNILRKRRSRSVPVAQGTLTAYFTDRTFFTARDNETRYGLAIQVGSRPGNTILITCPFVQITDVQRVGAEELAGVQITWEALDNRSRTATASNTELVRSPLSIHFL